MHRGKIIMTAIPIFYTCDTTYLPFTSISIASICEMTSSDCEFFILGYNLDEEDRQKALSVSEKYHNCTIHFFDIGNSKYFRQIEYTNNCPHVTIATYGRFLVGDFSKNYDKIIYLDGDILALGDISQLFHYQLEGKICGACSENFLPIGQQKFIQQNLKLKNDHKYFNAGVLLIDSKKWREYNIKSKLFKIERTYREVLKQADQDCLNILFNGNYLELPDIYNLMTQEDRDNNNIILRHFNTCVKPWNFLPSVNRVKNQEDFWRMAQRTPFYEKILQKAEKEYHERFYRTQLMARLNKLQKHRQRHYEKLASDFSDAPNKELR